LAVDAPDRKFDKLMRVSPEEKFSEEVNKYVLDYPQKLNKQLKEFLDDNAMMDLHTLKTSY